MKLNQLKFHFLGIVYFQDEFDLTENLFRIGYQETKSAEILEHIIVREELIE